MTNKDYSNLEVDRDRHVDNDKYVLPMVEGDPRQQKISQINEDRGKQTWMSSIETNYNKHTITSSDEGESSKETVHGVLYNSSRDHQAKSLPLLPSQRKILGLRKRSFYISLVATIIVIAVVVGGATGGTMASRNKETEASSSTSNETASINPDAQYANTGLGAVQFTDTQGILHKKVYYQDKDNKIKESAWDNSSDFKAAWHIDTISDAMKPGTPITSVAGYQSADEGSYLNRNVYYLDETNRIIERQASYIRQTNTGWKDAAFSTYSSGSNSTLLDAYWNQDVHNKTQKLSILFQEANIKTDITQAHFTGNRTITTPWVTDKFGISTPEGAVFRVVPIEYEIRDRLMLYATDNSNSLQQYEYTISDKIFDAEDTILSTQGRNTTLIIEPRTPFAVVAQDNQPLYKKNEAPKCTAQTPLTHLIFYALPDRASLGLQVWNCTNGFEDHTAEIQPLQKQNTTILSLAAMSDHATGEANVYIMYESGDRPEIMEWRVPTRAGEPWETSREVTADFA